ncbi:MAG: hypothetical protein ABI388_08610 [Bacteroidia bacterium]
MRKFNIYPILLLSLIAFLGFAQQGSTQINASKLDSISKANSFFKTKVFQMHSLTEKERQQDISEENELEENEPKIVLLTHEDTMRFINERRPANKLNAPNSTMAAPGNDNCASATALTSGVLLAGQTTAGATNPASDPNPTCCKSCKFPWVFFGGGAYNSVWYTITIGAASTIQVNVTDGTMTYAAVSIYSGACGSLSQVGCNSPYTSAGNPTKTTNCLPAGTYYIMVWDDWGTGGSFSIMATAVPCVSNNDPCASAYAIPTVNLDGTWNTGFTTVGHTQDGTIDPYGYACNLRNDWFSFVAQGPNIEITVASPVSCMNPEIELYSTNPCAGSGTEIGVATQQTCLTGVSYSSISLLNNVNTLAAPFYFTLTTGNTYWFSVNTSNAGACKGTYSVNVNNPSDPDPPGTDCATGEILCAGGTFSGASNLWGSQELNSSTVSCCNLGEEINSTWYVINILTGGTLTFTLQAVNGVDDYDYAMYKVATCFLGAPVSCNYSSYPGITGISTTGCSGGTTGASCAGTCANGGSPSGVDCDGCSNVTNAVNFNAASSWNKTLNVATGDVYIFYVNGYTPSSGSYFFTFGGTAVLGCTLPVVLPISLLSYNVTVNRSEVNLDWSTSSETNNNYFTIERSADGKNFEEFARVKGAGTSTEKRNYATIDYAPLPGASYYRLSQTDFNGKMNYLTIKMVNFAENKDVFSINQTLQMEL